MPIKKISHTQLSLAPMKRQTARQPLKILKQENRKQFPWKPCPMNLNNHQKAILALILASIIWGATGPVMKLTLKEVPLVSLAFIRFFAAAIILFPFVFRKISIKRNDIPILIISAFLGVTLNITLFFWGLTLTSALNSGIIIASGPILLLLFAHIFLKDKLS